jgi:hypothetical protein
LLTSLLIGPNGFLFLMCETKLNLDILHTKLLTTTCSFLSYFLKKFQVNIKNIQVVNWYRSPAVSVNRTIYRQFCKYCL